VTAVHGTCAPEFAAVREQFTRNLTVRGEVGAAVHVMVRGETVVDLWGGTADPATGRPWDADTLVCVFSCTKGVVALAAHVLIDRGLLDLEAPVTHYWPDFGAAGKEDITVRMLLDHSAGLAAVDAALSPGDMYDADLMARHVAAQKPWWEPGTRHGYSFATFGWTIGEVVRRVSGRSLGRFVADEVARGADFHLGLPEELDARVAGVVPWVPRADAVPSPFLTAVLTEPSGLQATAVGNVVAAGVDSSTRAFRAAEMGATTGHASARGLAEVYAGVEELVGPDTLVRMTQTAVAGLDALLLIPTRFGLGFMVSTDNRRRTGRDGDSAVLGAGAFGHVGMGGSIGFSDPAEQLAFGYVMNRHGDGVLLNVKGQSLVDATYRSLGFRSSDAGVWRR
jgi:CubicO group peptidase (beta-lactamase class C family)